MKRVIFIDDHASELRCDNVKHCDYVAPEGAHKWGRHLIGLPCPVCGESLLTERDYQTQERIYLWIEKVNRFFAFFGIGVESLEGYEGKTTSIGVRAHNGGVEIRPEPDDVR